MKDILPVLRDNSKTDDEGDRDIIAKIVGKILSEKPEIILAEVEKMLGDASDKTRAVYALSFKYWKTDNPQLKGLLSLLDD